MPYDASMYADQVKSGLFMSEYDHKSLYHSVRANIYNCCIPLKQGIQTNHKELTEVDHLSHPKK